METYSETEKEDTTWTGVEFRNVCKTLKLSQDSLSLVPRSSVLAFARKLPG